MTSSNGNIFRVTGPLCGEFTGPGEFPAQMPVTRSFDAFFDLRPNKRLSKQSWGWWFETPSWSLWCHCNGLNLLQKGDEHGALTEATDVDHVKNREQTKWQLPAETAPNGSTAVGAQYNCKLSNMKTSWHVNAFRIISPLCGDPPLTKCKQRGAMMFLPLAVGLYHNKTQQNVQRVHYSCDIQNYGIKPRKKHG